jgi:hypothetical protein
MTGLFADAIALLHAIVMIVYITGAASVLQGGFLRPSLKRWQRLYLGIVLLISLSVLFTDGCYLTQLENAIRAIDCPEACYECSYIGYYLPFVPDSVDTFGSALLLIAGCAATLSALWRELQPTASEPSPTKQKV